MDWLTAGRMIIRGRCWSHGPGISASKRGRAKPSMPFSTTTQTSALPKTQKCSWKWSAQAPHNPSPKPRNRANAFTCHQVRGHLHRTVRPIAKRVGDAEDRGALPAAPERITVEFRCADDIPTPEYFLASALCEDKVGRDGSN